MEIAAAIVGVVLTALIGFYAARYRSLITYEVIQVPVSVGIEGNGIVPQNSYGSTEITTFVLKLENKGWRGVEKVRLHAKGMSGPFSIETKADSIGPETVLLTDVGNSLEISIDYFPRREKVEISFARFGGYRMTSIAGSGSYFDSKSIHYYYGMQSVFRFFVNLFAAMFIGLCIGEFIDRVLIETSTSSTPVTPATDNSTGNSTAT
jgi:hypothetical protein